MHIKLEELINYINSYFESMQLKDCIVSTKVTKHTKSLVTVTFNTKSKTSIIINGVYYDNAKHFDATRENVVIVNNTYPYKETESSVAINQLFLLSKVWRVHLN